MKIFDSIAILGIFILFFQNCSNVKFKEAADIETGQEELASQQNIATDVEEAEVHRPEIVTPKDSEVVIQSPVAEPKMPEISPVVVEKVNPVTCAIKTFYPTSKPAVTASTTQSAFGTTHTCLVSPKNYQVEVICDADIPDSIKGLYIQYHANYNRPVVINSPATTMFDYRGISYYLPGVASVNNIGQGKSISSLTRVNSKAIRFEGEGLFFNPKACAPGDCSCLTDWNIGVRIYIDKNGVTTHFNKENPATFTLK